jgi:type I restriction enzyme S subunit
MEIINEDWIEIPFVEILEKLESGKRPKGGVSGIESGIPSLGGEHLKYDGEFDLTDIKYVPEDFANSMKKGHIEFQDILIVKDGATTGKTSFVDNDFPFKKAVINEHVFLCRTLKQISPKFLFYFLYSSIGQKRILQNFKGTAQGGINTSFAPNTKIPIAPLSEQRAIVAKIEQLFSDLDNGIANLKKAQEQLKIYRQAVLKKAFEGELVLTEAEFARAEGRDYEPADVLLTRILKERREKWNGKGKYKEPVMPDTSGLPELPEGWKWINLGQITWSVRDGPHYSPEYVKEGIPFISGGNVRPDGVDFTNAKRITPELHSELSKRCKPEKGDILYTKGGTTGIARVNTYDFEFNVWVHVAILKLAEPVEPFYIQHALNSQFCYAQSQRFTHGVGNQDLGLTRMVNIILSFPPLAEQHRIVAEVERRLSVCDKLEETIAEALQKSEALRQSILKKAFEGKLLSEKELEEAHNAPDWEPADKLLERIKAEKEKPGTKKSF